MTPKSGFAGAGYSGTPLVRKLGIGEGDIVAALWAPPRFTSLLAPLPSGARVRSSLRGSKPFDVGVVFVRSERELKDRFARAAARLDPHGGLWVAWPKQSSPLATALRESHVRVHGLAAGLVDNKICAIDEDWSGLRFVVRTRDRPPRSGRR